MGNKIEKNAENKIKYLKKKIENNTKIKITWEIE